MREQNLRADAARNRAQIVEAARAAFIVEGIDVSMAEIARRAGVGFATAQRRFPTKADLVSEIFLEELSALESATKEAAARGGDPWEAFAAPIRACAAHQAEHPGLAGEIARLVSEAADSENRIAHLFSAIAAKASAAGVLRADVTLQDVLAILKANSGLITLSAGAESTASNRFIEVALRGLRAN